MKMQRGISGGFDLTGGHLYLWELGKRSSQAKLIQSLDRAGAHADEQSQRIQMEKPLHFKGTGTDITDSKIE